MTMVVVVVVVVVLSSTDSGGWVRMAYVWQADTSSIHSIIDPIPRAGNGIGFLVGGGEGKDHLHQWMGC